jgi:hypothetical protein
MSTIAAAAQTADHIDYWIRRHVIPYCHGTHPSQSQIKFIPLVIDAWGYQQLGSV